MDDMFGAGEESCCAGFFFYIWLIIDSRSVIILVSV